MSQEIKYIKGQTKRGFKFSINPKDLDDIEFMELLGEADKDPTLLPKVIIRLFGENGKKRMYNTYRDEKGRVPLTEISKALIEIFNLSGALKK
jgi:hypothetical protein